MTITDDIENCVLGTVAPDICFTFDDGTITNYDFDNPDCPKDLIIPETINGEAVTAINDFAFDVYDWTLKVLRGSLTSVVIPDTVTYIGEGTFEGWDYETNSGCVGQITYAKLPNNLTEIYDLTFWCNKLTSIKIPDSVTEIYYGSFWNNNIKNVTIPKNVTFIGIHVFRNNQLTNVTIGSGITYIGSEAFRYNYISQGNLTINRAEGTVEIAGNAFDNNGEDGVTPITPKYLVQ